MLSRSSSSILQSIRLQGWRPLYSAAALRISGRAYTLSPRRGSNHRCGKIRDDPDWETKRSVPDEDTPGEPPNKMNCVEKPPASAKCGKYKSGGGRGRCFIDRRSGRNQEVIAFVVTPSQSDD